MAIVNPFQLNPNAGVREMEHWWWQTLETGGVGVAHGDTSTPIEMPFTYGHVAFQLLNTVPASTVVAIVGAAVNDAAQATPILDAAGTALQLTAEKDMVFLTGGVPAWLWATVTGGAAGDMDLHMIRKFI